MIIEIIRAGDRIMIGMITGRTIVMIRLVMKIDSMIIEEMITIIGIKISHHLGIMVVNNINMVVIKINKFDHPTKNFISQKRLSNFSMILRDKTQISTMLDVHNLNRVKLVVHQSQIAIFARKMGIMQINVRLKTREKHLLLIWWFQKFRR